MDRFDAFDDVLRAARDGDEGAFAALWRWLNPPLLRWLTVVARTDVEDIASDVWLSVARGLDTFDGDDAGFRGWVFTIARRRAVDRTRHAARRPAVVPLDGVDAIDARATSSARVDHSDAVSAALELLAQLTPDQREVVALRVVAGMTVQETAAVVGKAESAVRVLCHRGLRVLARRLDAATLDSEVSA